MSPPCLRRKLSASVSLRRADRSNSMHAPSVQAGAAADGADDHRLPSFGAASAMHVSVWCFTDLSVGLVAAAELKEERQRGVFCRLGAGAVCAPFADAVRA